jgi:hypothetical protein
MRASGAVMQEMARLRAASVKAMGDGSGDLGFGGEVPLESQVSEKWTGWSEGSTSWPGSQQMVELPSLISADFRHIVV